MVKYLYWVYGNEGVHHITIRGKSFNAWAKPKVFFKSGRCAKNFAGNKTVHKVSAKNVPKRVHVNC